MCCALSRVLGNDLSTIYQAFEKLKLVLPDNAEVNEDIIEQYIGVSKYNNFELKDTLGNRDTIRVMRILGIIAAIVKRYICLWRWQ